MADDLRSRLFGALRDAPPLTIGRATDIAMAAFDAEVDQLVQDRVKAAIGHVRALAEGMQDPRAFLYAPDIGAMFLAALDRKPGSGPQYLPPLDRPPHVRPSDDKHAEGVDSEA
ncbi:hypothetical protein [Streptomyces sp.]|uniref:hypothetical protein n=1 Tax=Streptomyces sp. TaxID=1931 RepID=UPI002F936B2B